MLIFPPKRLNGLGKSWLILMQGNFVQCLFYQSNYWMNHQNFSIWHTIYHLFCNYFSYSGFFLTSFLQFFFIKASSNWFTIQITNNTSPRNNIFNIANNKNFFGPILSLSFSKNVFVFWYSNAITNFKFRIFFMRMFIVFSISIRCNINWFHFYCPLNYLIVFINNIT